MCQPALCSLPNSFEMNLTTFPLQNSTDVLRSSQAASSPAEHIWVHLFYIALLCMCLGLCEQRRRPSQQFGLRENNAFSTEAKTPVTYQAGLETMTEIERISVMRELYKCTVCAYHCTECGSSSELARGESTNDDIGSHDMGSDKEDQICSICLSDYEKDCQVLATTCNHMFHFDCVLEWLMENDLCPYCRAEMMTEKELVHAAEKALGKARVTELQGMHRKRTASNFEQSRGVEQSSDVEQQNSDVEHQSSDAEQNSDIEQSNGVEPASAPTTTMIIRNYLFERLSRFAL